MRTYSKNPRQITTKQFADLEKWLDQLGDLSGIVHNLETDEIIGGNQRARVFGLMKNEAAVIEMTRTLPEADRQGTVGEGYIHWRDGRYTYRQVRWDAETAELANLVANKAGGDWDWDVLAEQFAEDLLFDVGFTEQELSISDSRKKEKEVKGQYDISPELFERHDYILFYFDNEFDWQVAVESLDIKMVLSAPVGKRTLKKKGLSRVLPASRLLELLKND